LDLRSGTTLEFKWFRITVASEDPHTLEEQALSTPGFASSPLGFLDLELTPPGPPIPFTLRYDADPATEFKLCLRLADIAAIPGDVQPPFSKVFQFVEKLPGAGLVTARVSAADPNVLEPLPEEKVFVGAPGIALLIEGKTGGPGSLSFHPGVDSVDDILTLQVVPPTVLLGSSQFGLGLDGSIVLDQSAVAAARGPTVILGKVVTGRSADLASWTGLPIRKADFYRPPSIPFIGATKAETYLDIGTGASSGIDLSVAMRVERPGKPAVDILIECHGTLGPFQGRRVRTGHARAAPDRAHARAERSIPLWTRLAQGFLPGLHVAGLVAAYGYDLQLGLPFFRSRRLGSISAVSRRSSRACLVAPGPRFRRSSNCGAWVASPPMMPRQAAVRSKIRFTPVRSHSRQPRWR
jgi:hypothetical protein